MKTPSPKARRGFTLIELLVAMAITTLIVTVLVSITSLALDTWNRSRSEIRASRQAKAMVDSMASDFESMVSRRGNNFEWLFARS
ncbi:MAG: type II secretion system GspH family protein, partial [Akkermansiaceae bacterium]|nr:type II secretion system GspH family protein [Akkermansiaceae bacterium]